jgi:hypothetical protein
VDSRERVRTVLERQKPDRIAFAPNYWQWFARQLNHGSTPAELSGCRSQLDVLRHLGTDVFSRNLYCNQHRAWFGGLSEARFDEVQVQEREFADGADLVIERAFLTRDGTLTERQRYVQAESTLVQEKLQHPLPSTVGDHPSFPRGVARIWDHVIGRNA